MNNDIKKDLINQGTSINSLADTDHIETQETDSVPSEKDFNELDQYDIEYEFQTSEKVTFKTVLSCLQSSIPNIVQSLGDFSLAASGVYFASHLGDKDLTAAFGFFFLTPVNKNILLIGLGMSAFQCFGLIVILALDTGLYTQASHAYGAKKYKKLGLLMHKGQLINIMWGLLFVPLMVFLSPILKLLGQDPTESEFAGEFCILLIPGYFFFLFYDSAKMFIMAQEIFKPPMLIHNFTQVTNILWCLLFVTAADMGIRGIALGFFFTLSKQYLFLSLNF